MQWENEDQQDQDVAGSAVAALAAAQRHALQSGRERVLVINRNLVRTAPTGTTVIKALAPRKKVTERVKRAKQ